MSKKLRPLVLALILSLSCVTQASALEYGFDGADDYLFAKPTSEEAAYQAENQNVDRSKNTSLIPPGFGTPTSYLPGSGVPLTPNLIPGALNGGGLVSSVDSVTYPTVDTGASGSQTSVQTTGFTEVTNSLYYSGGYLGTLKIPALGVNVKVYQGTDSAALAKGAGHFIGTSIWDGNVPIAGVRPDRA